MTRDDRDAMRKRRLPLLTVRLLDALDAQDELIRQSDLHLPLHKRRDVAPFIAEIERNREFIRQLSERVAICSELLGKRACGSGNG